MPVGKVKLNKTTVESIPCPQKGQTIIWDADLVGFGLRVSKKTKTFIAQKRVKGERKDTRVSIGIYPHCTPDAARKEALTELGKMAAGTNPVKQEAEEAAAGITLKAAFDDYMANKRLKPKTAYNYERYFLTSAEAKLDRKLSKKKMQPPVFHDWLKKPLTGITREMVEQRHRYIGKNRGEAYANGTMRVLRAVINYAMDKAEMRGVALLPFNPVRKLGWFKVQRRTGHISAAELPAYWNAINGLKNPAMRDYFLVMLFTGLRKEEALRLRWEDANLEAKTIKIPDTKNNEPLVLPLSDYLHGLLTRRKEAAGGSGWVFPGDGKEGRITEPKFQIAQLRKATGSAFTIHDFRRTFATAAQNIGLQFHVIKRLLNHTMGDVTSGYMIPSIDQLREPVNQIADYILAKAGQTEGAKVIPMKRGKGL